MVDGDRCVASSGSLVEGFEVDKEEGDSRTTALQYCEAVPGGLVFKARRLLYHSTLGRE